jgi:hypothetical protein
MHGTCPGCKSVVSEVRGNAVKIRVSRTEIYKGVSYSCNACGCVLSVEMDPIALRSEVLKNLGGG